MKKFFQRFSEVSAVIFIFGLLAAIVMFINLVMPVSFTENWKEVRIPEGSTYSKAISILQSEGIINDRLVLLLLGRITMKDRKIRPGYYNLSSSMTPLEIFDQLINGKAIHFTITIPEGDTLNDIRAKLIEVKLIDYESWKIVSDKDFLKSLNINAPSLEGYLFPDTYIFAKGAEPATILKTMVQRLRENFDQTMINRIAELDMCENDVLTLASIIEKEAYLDDERAVISAVYHNRLKKKMRLQADPTAIYGIHTCASCITKADLRRKTPYNTYVINGLPPGPIASPGLKSIKAALYPSKANYLFFVSKNDGSHYFSGTNEEHSQAVLIYRHNNENNSTQNVQETSDQTDNARAN